MIDSSRIPATYANIVPATPKSRQPLSAIITHYSTHNHSWNDGKDNGKFLRENPS